VCKPTGLRHQPNCSLKLETANRRSAPLTLTFSAIPAVKFRRYALMPEPAPPCIKLLEPYAKMISWWYKAGVREDGTRKGWGQAGES
jgi:hypothetical protein